jgi:hypothetical protein
MALTQVTPDVLHNIQTGSTYIVTSTGTSATQLFWYELR